jgi:hypothetical protein
MLVKTPVKSSKGKNAVVWVDNMTEEMEES